MDRCRLAAIGTSASITSGMADPPHPRVHAAHRDADDQPQPLDAEVLGDEPMLQRHHVAVAVLRETARGGRRLAWSTAVAEAVREDQELPAASSGPPGRRAVR